MVVSCVRVTLSYGPSWGGGASGVGGRPALGPGVPVRPGPVSAGSLPSARVQVTPGASP